MQRSKNPANTRRQHKTTINGTKTAKLGQITFPRRIEAFHLPTLKLRSAAFFGEKPLAVKLLVPPAYDKPSHRQAEESRDCSALVEAAEVRCSVENQWTVVEIPALDPWDVVVVAAKP